MFQTTNQIWVFHILFHVYNTTYQGTLWHLDLFQGDTWQSEAPEVGKMDGLTWQSLLGEFYALWGRE